MKKLVKVVSLFFSILLISTNPIFAKEELVEPKAIVDKYEKRAYSRNWYYRTKAEAENAPNIRFVFDVNIKDAKYNPYKGMLNKGTIYYIETFKYAVVYSGYVFGYMGVFVE